ncbi:MAG TPA: FkbM family methyltransferase [Woeseiaceae bacterium]|nr:FkbM family methyltransferase [Woeseiaceae bacterium]
MAIAAWKRVEKSAGYQRKKLVLKRLVGREPRLRTDLDIPVLEEGGWRYCPGALDRDSVVYSLGIGKDTGFDQALMRRFGLQVHAFDPTPSTAQWLLEHPQGPDFHYHPWAVTAQDGALTLYPRMRRNGRKSSVMYTLVADGGARTDAIEVPAFSLGSIVLELGHGRLDLLKIDIEGAEYDVLDTLPDLAVKPRQLLVEFHHRFAGIGPARTVEAVAALRRQGFGLFAISDTGRELSFLRADHAHRGDRS